MGNEDISIMIAGVLRTLLNESRKIKNFDSALTKQAEELKNICELGRNFTNNDIFKKGQTLARSIYGQIKNSQREQTLSKSLLGLLNGLNVKFIDTSLTKDRFSGYHVIVPEGKNSVDDYWSKIQEMVHRDNHPYSGLCLKQIIIGKDSKINAPRFYPLFRDKSFIIDGSTKRVSFEEWWDGIILDDFTDINKMSRKDLVKTVADKDGYAHVDAAFFPKYEFYKNPPQIDLGYYEKRVSGVYENTPVGASIRQIAFELLYTIHNELSHLIDVSNPNNDFTPIGFKLTFDVTIDSEDKERLIVSSIFSKRPFIQRALVSSHFKNDPSPDKTFIINSIMPTELQKILDALNENNITARNIRMDNL